MTKSSRLRLKDVESAQRLIGECLELWADPGDWRQHLLIGACRLTHQAVGHYVEVAVSSAGGPPKVIAAADVGWRDDGARAHYHRAQAWMAECFEVMPGAPRLVELAERTGHAAALRPEICPDTEWYGSLVFNEFRRPACNDGHASSLLFDPRRSVSAVLSVNQDLADPPPTVRTRRIVAYVHRQIAPLIGTRLVVEGQRGPEGLTPRLREALDRLLAGDGEKQLAAALGVAPATAHEYVGRIYGHFSVGSRAELMAYFVRRRPEPQPPAPPGPGARGGERGG